MTMIIRDRVAAGRDLARALGRYRKHADIVVLALPRGGLPVAAEIARDLHAPLDIIVVRKLGTPGHEELAMGAIASGGARVLNESIVSELGIGNEVIERVAAREQIELDRRMKLYRGDRAWPSLDDKRVIVVDDGLATGATMRAAIAALREYSPAKIIVAVPVAPFEALVQLRGEADEVVCLETPEPFHAISAWYASFPQLSDDEVRRILDERWAEERAMHGLAPDRPCSAETRPVRSPTIARKSIEMLSGPSYKKDVTLRLGAVTLEGTLSVPAAATGLVVFVHGSGSSRFSVRNRYVAEYFNQIGLATLLFDLLTGKERAVDELTSELRFDIGLLTQRLRGALEWIEAQPDTAHLPVGLFGASTGAAAALNTAAVRPRGIAAVVSRGGRPDLALASLALVQAPTLLIVGGLDHRVIELNGLAAAELRCEHRLEIVPRATHLFEEPGKLEEAARLARKWFVRHLTDARPLEADRLEHNSKGSVQS